MIDVRDTKLKAFADGYHRPLDDQLGELRQLNEKEKVPLIMTETEGILRLLLELIKPERILELGTAHGYSALFFAKLLPGAFITTIERNPAMIEYAEKNISSFAEGSRIELRTGDAAEILKGLEDELSEDKDCKAFDFVFIDAGKSHYREFFEAAERISTENAVIVCDNILMKGWIVEPEGKSAKRHRTSIKYMHRFLDYLYSREDLEVTLLTGGDGLAIIRHK